jgi:hypothetical protein
MTTIDESLTAKGYTPAAQVPAVFGQPRTIEGIVIHHWGALGQTHDGVVDFFVNGPGQTSAHFVASAGRINCLVSPADAAWHCPGKNATHIGIECRPEATDADYATVAELVRWLRTQYGPLPLSMHRDWYSTACPGVWDISRIDALANATAVAPQSAPTSQQGFLMALTDAQQADLYNRITRYLDAPTSAIPDKVWGQTVLRGGQQISVKQELADAKTYAAQILNKPVAAAAAAPAIDVQALAADIAGHLSTSQAHEFIVALGQALPKE